MPGICTSAMTQDVSLSCGEDKNSCAEANAYTENPIDLSNRAVAVRTEGSSSTTEIIGASATRPDLFSRPGPIRAPTASPYAQVRAATAGGELYLGFETSGRHQFIALGALRNNAAPGLRGKEVRGFTRKYVQERP